MLIGNVKPLRWTVRDDEGDLIAPTVVTFQQTNRTTGATPDAFVFGLDGGRITNPSLGVYEFTFSPATAGFWIVKAWGTGTVDAATEMAIDVTDTNY